MAAYRESLLHSGNDTAQLPQPSLPFPTPAVVAQAVRSVGSRQQCRPGRDGPKSAISNALSALTVKRTARVDRLPRALGTGQVAGGHRIRDWPAPNYLRSSGPKRLQATPSRRGVADVDRPLHPHRNQRRAEPAPIKPVPRKSSHAYRVTVLRPSRFTKRWFAPGQLHQPAHCRASPLIYPCPTTSSAMPPSQSFHRAMSPADSHGCLRHRRGHSLSRWAHGFAAPSQCAASIKDAATAVARAEAAVGTAEGPAKAGRAGRRLDS